MFWHDFSSSSRQFCSRLFFLIGCAAAWAVPRLSYARAEEPGDGNSLMCRKLSSQAESQAFLLFSPSLSIQGVKIPNAAGGDTSGTGVFQGSEYQLRGALSLSPTDMVRGALTLEAAGAECERRRARQQVESTVRQGADYGRLAALKAQQTYIRSKMPRIRELVRLSERRLAQQLITIKQIDTLRMHAVNFEQKLIDIDAGIDSLAKKGFKASKASFVRGLSTYEDKTMNAERASSTARRLSAWRLNVSGGVIPVEPADWYGMVSLSYNLGGIAQNFAEDAYLDARVAELGEARYELRHAIERFVGQVESSMKKLRQSRALLVAQIETARRHRELLSRVDAPDSHELLAQLEMKEVDLEAERIYVDTLLKELSAIGGHDAH